MDKSIIYIALSVILLIACNSDCKKIDSHTTRHYFTNSKGEKMYEDIIKTEDKTILIKYMDDGSVSSINHYKGTDTTKKYGSGITFNPNGNILKLENHINGERHGENVVFHNNQIFDRWDRWLIWGDSKSALNETIGTDDENGLIIKQLSNFFTIKDSPKTIAVGDIYRYQINLSAPNLLSGCDNVYMVTGDFDKKFNPAKDAKLDTTWAVMDPLTPYIYKEIKTSKRGPQVVRGIIYEVKYKEGKEKIVDRYINHVFQLEFYVK